MGALHSVLDVASEVNTCQRQSRDRESYHTTRTVPERSTSSFGRWLIAVGSAAIAMGADHVTPPSAERLERSDRFTPELRSSRVSHATMRSPLRSAAMLACRSASVSLALTRTGLCHVAAPGARTLARISQLSGS